MAGIFKYAGVDLSTLGAGFQVLDGGKSLPPVRGGNLRIPYNDGERWVRKYYGPRSLTLAGELLASSGVTFDSWVDQLKALFPIASGEQKLEMQWPDATWRYVMAEVRDILLPIDASLEPIAAKVSIGLEASDPLWYGSALECSQARQAWAFDSGVNFDDRAHWFDLTSQAFQRVLVMSNTLVEASNAGSATTRKPVFVMSGAMSAPRIINTRNNYSVQLLINTTGLQQLVIDCGAGQATVDGAPVSPTLVVLGSGQVDWMHLEPNENTLQVITGLTPCSVGYKALYSPAYL